MDTPFRIRPAALPDVAALAEIERICFSDPWTDAGIEETIQSETVRSFIAQEQGQIVGYIIARISGVEGEILDLAVVPERRRLGIGRLLLGSVRAALLSHGVRELFLEVRESNRAAIELYRGHGFRPVGLRPRYYRNPPEDALVLRAPLDRGGISGV